MNALFIYLFFPSFHSSSNDYIFLIICFGLNLRCTCTSCMALTHFQSYQWLLWKEEGGMHTLFAGSIPPYHLPTLSSSCIVNCFFHISH